MANRSPYALRRARRKKGLRGLFGQMPLEQAEKKA